MMYLKFRIDTSDCMSDTIDDLAAAGMVSSSETLEFEPKKRIRSLTMHFLKMIYWSVYMI